MCSEKYPRQLPKQSGAIPQSSQLVMDWQTGHVALLPLSKDSKYALVCLATVSGLTQALFYCQANQVTIGRLKKQHHVQAHLSNRPLGYISNIMVWKIEKKNLTLNGGSISPITCKLQVNFKRERILKQQIKLLTGKTTSARKTKVMSQALIHLNAQPAGPAAPIH